MKTAASVPDAKADGTKLRTFFREVAPDHDEEKVYASDMKKVLNWYSILKDMPLFSEEAKASEAAEAEKPAIKVTEKPKEKPVAKKAPAAPKAHKVNTPKNPSKKG
jgi:outer membrane biosynthesis protein TonB